MGRVGFGGSVGFLYTPRLNRSVMTIYGMFGWADFMEDREKKEEVENRKENEWEGCLIERGRGREKW